MAETDETSRASARGRDGAERTHVVYVGIAGLLIFLALWVRPIASSLWLDELGTWWTVKDSLPEAIGRALEYQGQSPAYNLVAWLTSAIAGRHETVLRIPSLLASIGSVFILHRLVTTLLDREAALFAALGFLGLQGVAFAATEYRPYAFALFFVIGSTFWLVRWLDGGKGSHAAFYVVFTALVLWAHYLFPLALLSQIPYVAVRTRGRSTEVRFSRVVLAWGGAIVISLLPVLAQLASLWDRRESLSIPNEGTVEELLIIVFQPMFVGALVLGCLVARSIGRVELRPRRASSGVAVLLWTWLLAPPSILLLVSVVGPVDLFQPRYYLSAAPAGAALFGWAVGSVEPAQVRRVIGVVLAILAVFMNRGVLKAGEDWRGLAKAERSAADDGTLVLMYPAFVESSQLDWLNDPERRSYLLAPTSFYPMDGQIEPLPYVADRAGLRYVAGLIDEELPSRDHFLLVGRAGPGVRYRAWLDGRLSSEGWSSRVVGTFGALELIEFTKREVARSRG